MFTLLEVLFMMAMSFLIGAGIVAKISLWMLKKQNT